MEEKALRFIELLRQKYPHIDNERIYAKIMCGDFRVNGETLRDPSQKVPENAEIVEKSKSYVSRGGDKLSYAISEWRLDVGGKVFIDAGCSTGGFTDALLHSGARTVHAVDVGYNQLAYSLRIDSRVIVHERTNIMEVHGLDPSPHAAVMDLSFRSVLGAASHILSLVSDKWLVALIKPQFEYEPEERSHFNGVLTDRGKIISIVEEVLKKLAEDGVYVYGMLESPIKGRKGNTEFLARLGLEKGDKTPEELLAQL